MEKSKEPERATIMLVTKDGRRVKRYLDNMSEQAPLTLEEMCEDYGVDYKELVAKEIADRERLGSEAYDRMYAGFYAFEQIGQNIYDNPMGLPEHEIKDPLGMWSGRMVYTAGTAMLVESVSGLTTNLKSAGNLFASASWMRRYNKWVAACFGDLRALARVDFK